MRRLLIDRGLRRHYGAAARRRVLAEHDLPVAAARIGAILDRAAARTCRVSQSYAGQAPVTGSVLFYVQHLLGIGHLRRAYHLIDGMAREGLAVTLVSGGEPLPELTGTRRGMSCSSPYPRRRFQLQKAGRSRRTAGR